MTDHNRKLTRRDAREFANKCCFGNPKYRFRVFMAAQEGTLHPILEAKLWDIAGYFPKGKTDLSDEVGRGLLNFILRRPLTEDPLAEAKPVGSSSTLPELPAGQPDPEPRASIVPPARPKKRVGTGPPLALGEEVLP